MKKKYYLCLAALQFLIANLNAADPLFFNSEEHKSIVINNRILAKVNGKAISVYDVMKKMDMLFYRSFPEYTSSTVARYQFYQMQWKRVLQELIDKELVVADAEESKLPISAGDIRQEMESMFGPNIHANLDKVGLTYEEAMKMIQSDIVIKRMLYIRAHMKAMRHVTPQAIQEKYNAYSQENIRPDVWKYTVITIREPDKVKGAEAAHQVSILLNEQKLPLEEIASQAKKLASIEPSTRISVSEEYTHTDKEMSQAYKAILADLEKNTYSKPISQKSRADSSTVYRIFYLKEMQPGGVIPYNEISGKIKDQLLEEASAKETDNYLKKLRKHFDVQESHLDDVSSNFEPFQLQ